MENFTPFSALLGGGLLGLAAAGLMLFNGRIAGISGIVAGLLSPERGDTAWRLWFVGGMIAGPLLLSLPGIAQLVAGAGGVAPPPQSTQPLLLVLLAGLLVGLGTRLGSGCTSGHGICGIGRLSKRSIAATFTFMATAIATVYITRHLLA